jgi:hypothetical protein
MRGNMLYKRFGITERGVSPAIQERLARDAEDGIASGSSDLWLNIEVLVSMNIGVATRYYLLGDHRRARQFAERVLTSAGQYFFGDWRTKVETDEGKIDPEWWHDKDSWLTDFRGALCWGTVLERWQDVGELCVYPDERRGIETLDATPALRRLVIDIARWVRGEKVMGVSKACAKLDGFTWRGVDSLALVLDAVIERDERKAQDSIDEFFLKHHKRKKSKDITDTVSLDGTTILNIARRAKLNVTVAAEHAHYYIQLKK